MHIILESIFLKQMEDINTQEVEDTIRSLEPGARRYFRVSDVQDLIRRVYNSRAQFIQA